MEIGFVRDTRRRSATRQREDLTAAGVGLIEEVWEIAHAHIRPGNILVVTSLHLLANDERTYLQRLRDIEAHGGLIKDLESGRTHAAYSLAQFPRIKRAWLTEKVCQDPREMRRRGKRGGRPKAIPPKSAAEKMVQTYRRLDKTPAETVADLEQMHGIKTSKATVMRVWAKMK